MSAEIAARIRRIAESRFGGNLSRFSVAAGLSRQHVGVLISRLENERTRSQPAVDTLEAIARAGGVTLDWLRTGEGQGPEGADAPAASPRTPAAPEVPVASTAPELVSQLVRVVSRPERYPNRAIAAELARQAGDVPEEAIASVLRDSLQARTDPPVLWWADRMRIRATWLESGELPGEPYDAPRPPGIKPR